MAGDSSPPRDHGERQRFELRLYVVNQNPNSLLAIENLRRICEEHLEGDYVIEVVDLLEHPTLARDDSIVAVPTVVRRLPVPMRRLIGDLSDTHGVVVGLQLRELGSAQ